MKKFKFEFSAVLELRKTQEKEALRGLALAQEKLQNEISKKEQLLRQLDLALQRREAYGRPAARIALAQGEDDFIVGTKQRVLFADQAIFRANKEVSKALRIYLGAKKKSLVMETLLEKAKLDYKKEVNRYEQKTYDDLNIMRDRLKEKEI